MNTRTSRLIIVAGVAALFAAAPAMARDDDRYGGGHEHFRYDRDMRADWHHRYYAPRVVYARPVARPAVIYSPAPAYYYSPAAPVAYAPYPVYPNWGAIGGAVAGAALGSAVGDGRAAAIAAGSVIGAVIGGSAGY